MVLMAFVAAFLQLSVQASQGLSILEETHGMSCRFLEISNPFESVLLAPKVGTDVSIQVIPNHFELCGEVLSKTVFMARELRFARTSVSKDRLTFKLQTFTDVPQVANLATMFQSVRVCSCGDVSGYFRIMLSVDGVILAEQQAILGITQKMQIPKITEPRPLLVNLNTGSLNFEAQNLDQTAHTSCLLVSQGAETIKASALLSRQAIECVLSPAVWKLTKPGTYWLALAQNSLVSNTVVLKVTDFSAASIKSVYPLAIHAVSPYYTFRLELAGEHLPQTVQIRIQDDSFTAIRFKGPQYLANIPISELKPCIGGCSSPALSVSFDGTSYFLTNVSILALPDFYVFDCRVVDTNLLTVFRLKDAWSRAEPSQAGLTITSDEFTIIALLSDSSNLAAYECGLQDATGELMGLSNARVDPQRNDFGTFPLLCSFSLSKLKFLEPLRFVVRQQTFYQSEPFKTFTSPIWLKHETYIQPAQPKSIRQLRVNGVEHQLGSEIVLQRMDSIRVELMPGSETPCIFRSELVEQKQQSLTMQDSSLCFLPSGLAAQRLELFADSLLLTINLIDPIDLEKSPRVIVKQPLISFNLTTPIVEPHVSLLDQPICIFDVGKTSGQFSKEAGYPGKHSNLFTKLVCQLPQSITKSTQSQQLRLQQVLVGPLISSADFDIEIVFMVQTRIQNPWLPRFVELGEPLDFSKVLQMQALSTLQGECLFHIVGKTVTQQFKDLGCRFPNQFDKGFGFEPDQCYSVTRIEIQFEPGQAIEVANLVDFCLQSLQIVSVEPQILYKGQSSSLVVSFSRSLDLGRNPFFCVLQGTYETSFAFVKTGDDVRSGICKVEEGFLAVSEDRISVAIRDGQAETITQADGPFVIDSMPTLALATSRLELNRYIPEVIRVAVTDIPKKLRDMPDQAAMQLTTYIVIGPSIQPFITVISDFVKPELQLSLPAIAFEGAGQLRITGHIILGNGDPLALNELQVNYFPEIMVLPDSDLVLHSSDEIRLQFTPSTISIVAMSLRSREQQIKAEITQQITNGCLDIAIERPQDATSGQQYKVFISFQYATNEPVTELELRQRFTFYNELKLAQVSFKRHLLSVSLTGYNEGPLKCELKFGNRIDQVPLDSEFCAAGDLNGLQSISVIYFASGNELRTDSFPVRNVDVVKLLAPSMLVLPLSKEHDVVMSFSDSLYGVCNDFFLSIGNQDFKPRGICSDYSATMLFNLTDAFYLDGDSEKSVSVKVSNSKVLLHGTTEFTIMLIAPIIVTRQHPRVEGLELKLQYALAPTLRAGLRVQQDGREMSFEQVDSKTILIQSELSSGGTLYFSYDNQTLFELPFQLSMKPVDVLKLVQEPLQTSKEHTTETDLQSVIKEFTPKVFNLTTTMTTDPEPPTLQIPHINEYRIVNKTQTTSLPQVFSLKDSLFQFQNLTIGAETVIHNTTHDFQAPKPTAIIRSYQEQEPNRQLQDQFQLELIAQNAKWLPDLCVYQENLDQTEVPAECRISPSVQLPPQTEDLVPTRLRTETYITDLSPLQPLFNPGLLLSFKSRQLYEIYLRQDTNIALQACTQSSCLADMDLLHASDGTFTFGPSTQPFEEPTEDSVIYANITSTSDIHFAYGVTAMRWLPKDQVFGQGMSYFARVSDAFSKQFIGQKCEILQGGLFELYRESGMLLTEPAPGVNLEWQVRVPIDSIPSDFVSGIPRLHLATPPAFRVTSINYDKVRLETTQFLYAKVWLEPVQPFPIECLRGRLEVSWAGTQPLLVLHDDLSVIVPLTLLAQSPKVALFSSFKGIAPEKFQPVFCEQIVELFPKQVAQEDSQTDLTGCIHFTPVTLIRGVGYQVLRFKLPPSSRSFSCIYDDATEFEAMEDEDQYLCRVPKLKHGQLTTRVKVVTNAAGVKACPGLAELKLADRNEIVSAQITGDQLRVELEHEIAPLTLECFLEGKRLKPLGDIFEGRFRTYRVDPNQLEASQTLRCGYAENQLQVKSEFTIDYLEAALPVVPKLTQIFPSEILISGQQAHFALQLANSDTDKIHVSIGEADAVCYTSMNEWHVCQALLLNTTSSVTVNGEQTSIRSRQVGFASPELIISKQRTIVLMASNHPLLFGQYSLTLTAEDETHLNPTSCHMVTAMSLYCVLDRKFVDGVSYTVTNLHFFNNDVRITVPLDPLTFVAFSQAQESLSIEITPRYFFIDQNPILVVSGKPSREIRGFKVAYCGLEQAALRMFEEAAQSTCSFETNWLQAGHANVRFYDRLGYELYSDTIDIIGRLQVEGTSPSYIVQKSQMSRRERVTFQTENIDVFRKYQVIALIQGIGTFKVLSNETAYFEYDVLDQGSARLSAESSPQLKTIELRVEDHLLATIPIQVLNTDIPEVVSISNTVFFSGVTTGGVKMEIANKLPDSEVLFWLEPVTYIFTQQAPTVPLKLDALYEKFAEVTIPAGVPAGDFFIRFSQDGVANDRSKFKVSVIQQMEPTKWKDCMDMGDHVLCGCGFSSTDLLLSKPFNKSIRLCAQYPLPSFQLSCELRFNSLACQGQASFESPAFGCEINLKECPNISERASLVFKVIEGGRSMQLASVIGIEVLITPVITSFDQTQVILTRCAVKQPCYSIETTLAFEMEFYRPGVTFCELDSKYKTPVIAQNGYKCVIPADMPIQPGEHSLTLVGSTSVILISSVSTNFFTSTQVEFTPKDLFQTSKLETVIVSARVTLPFSYQTYANIRLMCNLSAQGQKVFSTSQCGFVSETLDAVFIQVPVRRLKHGSYQFSLTLQDVETPLFAAQLLVHQPPQILGLYPTFIVTETTLFLRGTNFQAFNNALAICKLTKHNGDSFLVPGTFINDGLFTCRVGQSLVDASPRSKFDVDIAYKTQLGETRNRITTNAAKLKVQITESLQILDVNTEVITSTVFEQEGSIALTLTESPALFQANKWCDFSDSSGQIVATTEVVLLSPKDEQNMLVQCDVPVLNTKQPDVAEQIKIRVRVRQLPTWDLDYPLYEVSSENGAIVNLIPLPKLSLVDPNYVFNTMRLEMVIVTGINFFNSQSLVCLVDQAPSPAVFINSSQVKCAVKIKQIKPFYAIQVSNDNLRTLSNALQLTVQTELPRITKLIRPAIFFADSQPIRVVLQGKNFAAFSQPGLQRAIGITLKAQSKTDTTTGQCEALSDDYMECQGLQFRQTGIYRLSLLLTGANCDEIQSTLDIRAVNPIADIMLVQDRFDIHQPVNKARFVSDEIEALMKVYPPWLFSCVVYSDGGVVLYETPLIQTPFSIQQQQESGALECECRCPLDTSSLTLDFRIAIDSYFFKRTFKTQCLQYTVVLHSIEVALQATLNKVKPNYHAVMFLDDLEDQAQSLVLFGEHFEQSEDAQCLIFTPAGELVARVKAELASCKSSEGYSRLQCKVQIDRDNWQHVGKTYVVKYSQLGYVYPEGSSPFSIEFRDKPLLLKMKQRLLQQGRESQIVAQTRHTFQDTTYECVIETKSGPVRIAAFQDFAQQTLTCDTDQAPTFDSTCYMVRFEDHYGNTFGEQLKPSLSRREARVREQSSEVCFVNQVMLKEYSPPSVTPRKFPFSQTATFPHFTIELSADTASLLQSVIPVISSVQLHTNLFITEICLLESQRLKCPMPQLTEHDTVTLDLSLSIFGKWQENLLLPLNAAIQIYKNVLVTGSITSEPGLIIQTIDSHVQVLGNGFPASSGEIEQDFSPPLCFFVQKREQYVSLATVNGLGCICPVPLELFKNLHTVTLRVSLNGGLNFSDGAKLSFAIYRAPNVERVSFSQGRASVTNSNFITVGRQEQKIMTLHGTSFEVIQYRAPWCLFDNFRTPATFIDQYTAQCPTPVELMAEYALSLPAQQLKVSLEWTSSDQSSWQQPTEPPHNLNVFTWPVLRTIDGETSPCLLDHQSILLEGQGRRVYIEMDRTLQEEGYKAVFGFNCPGAQWVTRPLLNDKKGLYFIIRDQDLATLPVDQSTLICQAAILEEARQDTVGLNPLSTHQVVFIVSLDQFAIQSIDKTNILMGPWTSELRLTVTSSWTKSAIETLSKQVRCALVYKDQNLEQHVILSLNTVLQNTGLKCYFKEDFTQRASYCVELALGPDIVTKTCSKTLKINHAPTVAKTVEKQDQSNAYSFDSFISGTNLAEDRWVCYYFFYELDLEAKFGPTRPYQLGAPQKILYSDLAIVSAQPNNGSKLTCQFSDALIFYTKTNFIKTIGVTDLKQHFSNKSIQMQSLYMADFRRNQGVFVLAHLLEVSPPSSVIGSKIEGYKISEWQSYEAEDTSQQLQLFHPGDAIEVTGYFLDNSESGAVYLRLESLQTSDAATSDQCVIQSALKIQCKLKTTHSLFGELYISLHELESSLLISDSSVLSVLVLPLPQIRIVAEQRGYVTSLTTETQTTGLQVKVAFDQADLLSEFKHVFVDRTICKLVKHPTSFELLTTKTTWTDEGGLDCYFANSYVDDESHLCIEVSINGGAQFTSDCKSTVKSQRIPVVKRDAYSPTYSHVQDPVILNFEGERFDITQSYKCVFSLKTVPDDFGLPSTEVQSTIVTVLSATRVECQTPETQFSETHSFYVSLVHNASGLTVHRYSKPFTYISYLKIDSVSPTFASAQGDTLLQLKVSKMALLEFQEQPLQCRFSFQFDLATVSFETPATLKQKGSSDGLQFGEQVDVLCRTPDVRAAYGQFASSYDYDDHVDVYLQVSELDGQFRRPAQFLFVFKRAYEISYVSPNRGYIGHQKPIMIKGINFLPEKTLLVRLRTIPTNDMAQREVFRWDSEEIFFVDRQTLTVYLPSSLNLQNNNRVLVFEVSLNGGAEWTTQVEPAKFTFKPTPQMLRYSHQFSTLRGKFTVDVYGYYFEDNIVYCQFKGQELQTPALFVSSTLIKCPVPTVAGEFTTQIKLVCDDGYVIEQRRIPFDFVPNEEIIFGVWPTIGNVLGGDPFTIRGNFSRLLENGFVLLWQDLDITSTLIEVTSTQIRGVTPAGHPGRAEIIIICDNVTYHNLSVYFYFTDEPFATSCWPPSGQSSSDTLLRIHGRYFDGAVKCQLGDEPPFLPIELASDYIICPMAPHKKTKPIPIRLHLWDGVKTIEAGCTYFYYDDIIVNSLQPNFISSKAGDNGVVIKVRGLFFRNDDPAGNSFRIRIGNDLVLDQADVSFVNATYVTFKAPNFPVQGKVPVFFSNNYGIQWTDGSRMKDLYYHPRIQIQALSLPKIQIPLTDNDFDRIRLDLEATGQSFPTDPSFGPLWCIFGSNFTSPFYETIYQAQVVSSSRIVCRDMPQYNSQILPGNTYVEFKVTQNRQEYWGYSSIHYYPRIRIDYLSQHNFAQNQERIVFEVHGDNFLNYSPNQVMCVINRIVRPEEVFNYFQETITLSENIGDKHFSAYVQFVSPQVIKCSFERVPMVHSGIYKLQVTNNGVQWVQYERQDRGWLGVGANGVLGMVGQIDIRKAILMRSIEPKIILTRSSQVNRHVISVEAENMLEDSECYFVLNSTDRASLVDIFDQSQIVKGTLVDDMHLECLLPPDFTDVGETVVNVRVGFERNVKTMSQSSIALKITDKCPNGYFCQNYDIQDCPKGHYCPGGGYLQDKRPCPIGYFQPKSRSQRCLPCIRGSFCEKTAMINPTMCPAGHICNVQKLTSPRAECPPGYYCKPGTQGNEPFFNGLYDNNTYHCDVGTYCRGGQSQRLPRKPLNFEATVTDCLKGFICPQGSKLANGVGACPAGYFCPHQNTTNIICPPRFFCPDRANIEPIPCPRGTFNMHYGQKNCTVCSLGKICPLEGMLVPLLCPPGYVCNKEGLITPDNLCRMGNICLGQVKSGLMQSERACFISNQVSDNPKDLCKGVLYSSQNSTVVAAMPQYFFNKTICCTNIHEIAKWIMRIGEAINEKEIFKTYAQQLEQQTMEVQGQYEGSIITVDKYDGHLILEKSFNNETIGQKENVNFVNLRHKAVLQTFIKVMYTTDSQVICPGGLLCLEGVNKLTEDVGSVTSPFACPLGSYCLLGSESVIGTGLCPQGFYCPSKTEIPFPAQPGYFTSNYGAVDQSPCSPGTFQLFSKSTKCNFCPAGYMCKNRGTSMPEVCPVGSYRSVIESNICSLCPKGTFAFERGNKDYLECQECPPGRICELEGIKNITETAPCTDGLVCFSGTGARKSILCPEGYYCPEQTTGETMYAKQCEGGFFCRQGTGLSTKTRDNCPQTYYCPPGTGVYNYVLDYKDYSNWRTDALTRCPQGSGMDNADTKKVLLQCVINPEYRLLKPGLDLRANYPNPRETTATKSTRILRTSSVNRRSLVSTSLASTSAGKDNPYLLDLYEIEFAISQFKKGNSDKAVFQDWLNLQRNYITRVNPLNLSFCDAWNKSETLDANTRKNNEPQVIFSLEPHHYALITMDFRHILPQEYNWVYGDDWSIAITVKKQLELNDKVDPLMLPEQFLHKETMKSNVIEFELLALSAVQFRIEVLIHNALYLNHKYAFQNTTSVEIRKPNRAKYETDQIIATQIEDSFFITLPYNQLPLQPNKQQLPLALISFSKNYLVYDPIIHSEVKNRNIWIPASLYWNQRKTITMSYLPYFSNCQGYGDYIPFWALMEQHHQCSLVSVNETIFMKELSFGKRPTSDTCESVVIPCVYDEIPANGQPLPRWFEVEGGTTLFNLIKEPINQFDFKTRIFDTSELLAVGPGDQGAGDEGTIPQSYIFTVSYYQLNSTYKRLIQAGIEYDQFLKMSDAQANGEEKIGYNITFNFESMSHEALTIAFAFQPYFYIILFIIMGVFSITAMIAMCIYHRLVARPHFGKIAPFRFFSFIKLTIPPCAYGVGLACLPVLIINLLITIIINGRVLTYSVQLFQCWTTLEDGQTVRSAPEECQSTLFDIMKDDSSKISVDYDLLRKGRCGLALFISGVYGILVGQAILIPDTTHKTRVAEAYDGNVWTYYKWKRSNLVFCSVWVIFIALALIQFSFSDYFGAQIYLSIVLLKVFDQFLEVWLEKMLEENLIFAPLMIYYGLICGLVTFGSNDFLDFINAYFIEFGMMIYERTYNNDVIDFVKEYIEEDIPNFFTKFIEFWRSEKGDLNIFGGDDSESSDSKLDLTDEDSFGDDKIQKDFQQNEQVLYKPDAFWHENNSSSEFSAKFRTKTTRPRDLQSRDDSDKASSEIEYGQETQSERGSSRLESSEAESGEEGQESSLEEGLNEVEVEPLLDEYLNYASDDIGLFYAPIFVLLLWAFYPETVVAANYGIMIYDFKYYFLFQVVIVPFQVVVDVIQLNITEWYHHKPMHDYLDYLAFRFSLRKARWKGDEGNENINTFIEKNLQSLDQLCFSSQFYFVQTIYVAGMAQVTLGMQTLLWVPTYNCFADQATIPLSLMILLLCFLTEKLCIKAGDILRVWHIDEVIEKEVLVDERDEFITLVNKVQQLKDEGEQARAHNQDEEIPAHLLWKHKHWGRLDRQKIHDLQMKADLNTDRVIAQNFKDIFLEHNKPWLKANVHELLTPRTIFVQREVIIKQLGLILDPEHMSQSGSQKSQSESDKSGIRTSSVSLTSADSSEAENPFALLQKAQRKKAMLKHQRQEEERQRNRKMSKQDADKITVTSRLIIMYWLLRTRLLRKLRIHVQAFIDMNLQAECLFCRTQYGLKVEVMESLEDMFYDFLDVTGSTIGDYNYQQWISYFKRYASYRTTCYNCYERLEVAYRAQRRKFRKQEKIAAKRRQEQAEIMAMTNAERKKFFEHIYSRSERAVEVIGLWLAQARLHMSLRDEVIERNKFFARREKRQQQLRSQKLTESFIEDQLKKEGLEIPQQ